MKRALHFCFAILLCSFFLFETEAADTRAPDPFGGTGGGPIAGSLQVRVVRQGTTDPMAGAFVMAGSAPGDPFPGNYGFTSTTGEIAFAHPALFGPIAVTAGAPGCPYFTLVGVNADDLVLALKPIETIPLFEVGDFVSGVDVNNGIFHAGDGNLDLAVVLPAFTLEDMISFDAADLFGPPEVIEILGNPVEIPANMFLPQQWELFVEIAKDHYSLNLPEGPVTLSALSSRAPLDVLTGGGDMVEMLAAMDWREIDILDIAVTGPTTAADLNVDPDLVDTASLQVANAPEGSTAWCISMGDLDALHGLGRLIPLGFGALALPAGSGGSGSLTLSTTAATGEFSGMDYLALAAVVMDEGEDSLVILDRASHPQTYTAALNSFFRLLDLDCSLGRFSWNDAANPASGSPVVSLYNAKLTDLASGETVWEFMMGGGTHSFRIPFLPPAAPSRPAPGSAHTWNHAALGLGFDLASFDFNAFAFSAVAAHSSHMALDSLEVAWPRRNLSEKPPGAFKPF